MTKTFFMAIGWLIISIGAAGADPYQTVREDLAGGRLDNAKTAIDQLLTDNPFDRDARLLEAAWLQTTGATDEATTRLELLAEAYPADPEPYNNLAVLAMLTGDTARAEHWLQKALATNTAYQTVVTNLDTLRRARAQEAYTALSGRSGRASVSLQSLQQFTAWTICADGAGERP
ncbi:MAG: hypothetical protein AAGH76_10420 [Pseudomonadota bacterium]